jgi:transcriptional regulator with XRE-family HTH domain
MNTPELRALKMAWVAAKEAGDRETQLRLLRENPVQQDELIEFIAGYHATGGSENVEQNEGLLPVTQRAIQSILERAFESHSAFSTLTELRKSRRLSKLKAAQGLRLSIDVWDKFENGAIELVSLSQQQMERLAQFFQVSIEQFGNLLNSSQAAVNLNRRQTGPGTQNAQHGPQKQSLAEAIARSTMTKEEKELWSE